MVGGYSNSANDEGAGAIGTIGCFKEELQKWDRLPSMPTARANACVISTPSVLVIAGGNIVDLQSDDDNDNEGMLCTAVEVYRTDTMQWSITDPLPAPAFRTSAIIVSNTCYFMGLLTEDTPTVTILHAPIPSLLQKAVCASDTHQSAGASSSVDTTSSVWKELGNIPDAMICCTAATLGGVLLGHGGTIEDKSTVKDEGTVYSNADDDNSDEDSDDSENGFSSVNIFNIGCTLIILFGSDIYMV